MNHNKCAFYNKGYCKNETYCPKLNPNADCVREYGDKRTCKKQHRTQCKNCISCEWNSCEYLHTIEWQEQEISEKHELKKIIEAILKDIDKTLKLYSDDITDCKSRSYWMETEKEGVFDKAEAVDEEHSI